MDVVAALVPPLVVAVAFVAIVRAAIRHTDRSPGSAQHDQGNGQPGNGQPGNSQPGNSQPGNEARESGSG